MTKAKLKHKTVVKVDLKTEAEIKGSKKYVVKPSFGVKYAGRTFVLIYKENARSKKESKKFTLTISDAKDRESAKVKLAKLISKIEATSSELVIKKTSTTILNMFQQNKAKVVKEVELKATKEKAVAKKEVKKVKKQVKENAKAIKVAKLTMKDVEAMSKTELIEQQKLINSQLQTETASRPRRGEY